MENDVLAEVVETEREIQQKLDRERVKAGKWLEKIRKEAEKEVSQAEEDLEKSLADKLLTVTNNAEQQAAEILRAEREKAAVLEKTGEDVLKTVVLRHLRHILPREEK